MAPGFDTEDLLNLHKYEAAVKARFREETLPAFSLHTAEPLVIDAHLQRAIAREHDLRERSIATYTPKRRAEVMAWLNARYTRVGTGQTTGNMNTIVDIEPIA